MPGANDSAGKQDRTSVLPWAMALSLKYVLNTPEHGGERFCHKAHNSMLFMKPERSQPKAKNYRLLAFDNNSLDNLSSNFPSRNLD